jgi:hypothetical protein
MVSGDASPDEAMAAAVEAINSAISDYNRRMGH